MPVLAKLAVVAVSLGVIWDGLGPKIAAAAAVITAATAAYREVIRPLVRMVQHAGDVYEGLVTMDKRVDAQIKEIKAGQDALSAKVGRLADNAQAREDELEKRLEKVETVLGVLREFVGTRSGDRPRSDTTPEPAAETG